MCRGMPIRTARRTLADASAARWTETDAIRHTPKAISLSGRSAHDHVPAEPPSSSPTTRPRRSLELFEARGLGDGLPLVPPTRERVDAMLATADGDPDEVLTTLLPRAGIVTRRVVAINAVLAGCPPATFPVVLTAVRALAAPGDEPARA